MSPEALADSGAATGAVVGWAILGGIGVAGNVGDATTCAAAGAVSCSGALEHPNVTSINVITAKLTHTNLLGMHAFILTESSCMSRMRTETLAARTRVRGVTIYPYIFEFIVAEYVLGNQIPVMHIVPVELVMVGCIVRY